MIRILTGDCIEVMATLPAASVDSIVTDPPYGIRFMGKAWDSTGIANSVEMWREALRVLKPGGHLLAFGGTRTFHRMVCAIEDAGFEIRDQIAWVYSSGFPKSHDLDNYRGDTICGCEPTGERDLRPVPVGDVPTTGNFSEERGEVLQSGVSEQGVPTAGRSQLPAAQVRGIEPSLEGRGNASQPQGGLRSSALRASACVGRIDGTEGRLPDGTPTGDGAVVRLPADAHGSGSPRRSCAAEQRTPKPRAVAGQSESQAGGAWTLCSGCGLPVLPRGIGTALKPAQEPICMARKPLIGTVAANVLAHGTGGLNIDGCRVPGDPWRAHSATGLGSVKFFSEGEFTVVDKAPNALGRWPANLIHDGSDEVLAAFPQSAGAQGDVHGTEPSKITNGIYGKFSGRVASPARVEEDKSAARFFYCAKASKADRNEGLDAFTEKSDPAHRRTNIEETGDNPYLRGSTVRKNTHPTVKPTELMRYLCRLVTPPGGTVLDPFMGSGSTIKAAEIEGFSAIGIELDPVYVEIARSRISSDAPLFAVVEAA